VAVLLDEEARGRLAVEVDRLRATERASGTLPEVVWVAPENLHLTVKFLGAVATDRVADIERALGEAVTGLAAFDLTLRGLGAFPSAGRPRIIWAGVAHGAAELAAVAAHVERTLSPLGFPAEDRPFSAHITLGRVRTPRRNPRLAAALAASANVELGRLAVARVSLMRSDLSPRGARYSELAGHALAAGTLSG
jgi:RNA 2',3'-cyclic 3'-phosphodiesterase